MKIPFYERRSLFATFVVFATLLSAPTLARPGCHDDGVDAAPDVGVPVNPITSAVTQMRRLCGALCASGLGGVPCGVGCHGSLPKDLPRRRQSNASDVDVTSVDELRRHSHARRDACPLLCDNGLGFPLCPCSRRRLDDDDAKKYLSLDDVTTNWDNVCNYYCVKHAHRLAGCLPCRFYTERPIRAYLDDTKMAAVVGAGDVKNNGVEPAHSDGRSLKLPDWLHHKKNSTDSDDDDNNNNNNGNDNEIDWEAWCKQQCKTGDGGAACNCDLLPFSLPVVE